MGNGGDDSLPVPSLESVFNSPNARMLLALEVRILFQTGGHGLRGIKGGSSLNHIPKTTDAAHTAKSVRHMSRDLSPASPCED